MSTSPLTYVRDLSSRLPGSATTQALVVGALVGFLAYLATRKRYRLPPGPFALPLLGNMMMMRDKAEPLYIKLRQLAVEKYGPVITVYMGTVRCVTLNSLQVINEALLQKGADFAGRPFIRSMDDLADGSKNVVFADYGPAWKLRRKIAMQAVRHYLRGAQLQGVVHREVETTVRDMLAEGKPFDPAQHINMLICRIIDSTCFGTTKYKDCLTVKELVDLFDAFAQETGSGFLEDVIPLLRFFPTPKFRRAKAKMHAVLTYIHKNIDEHRASFDPDNIRDITDSILLAQSEVAREESPDTMAMFTDAHVAHTLSDIFGAGVDTSRMTLTWAIFFLAGYPEVQKRMQQEIDAATGSRMPGVGDKAKLQYSEAVLYEVMRLATVVPLSVPHKTTCDTTVGGYDVPKDTMVLVNMWAAMHDPEKWDEPMELRPERFLDDEGKLAARPEGWMPFSVGRRSCLGESVAKPELLLVLTCLLKRFSVSLPPGVECKVTDQLLMMILNPPKTFQVIVTPR